MKHNNKTLSWDEYKLLKYELLQLHNQLTTYETRLLEQRLLEHTRLITSMNNVKHEIEDLLYHLKTSNIVL